mmetsp:Transcript_21409/g.31170  ORF Transcript_21409/g.31170 Transcript_21409/m.31170 type:complete len:138 (-) Transcript_21409:514-927(-)
MNATPGTDLSLHNSGLFLGYKSLPDKLLIPTRRGYTLNMPLLPNTGDEVFVPLVRKAAEKVKNAYNPKAVVLVAGPDCLSVRFFRPLFQIHQCQQPADGSRSLWPDAFANRTQGDPLGELRVSVQGLTRTVHRILDW